jgi:septation ring formation regulator EzrA
VATLEQTKVVQAINRLESIRLLLNEVSKKEEKYTERFSHIADELKKFGEELMEISEKMKVENLGKNESFKNEK